MGRKTIYMLMAAVCVALPSCRNTGSEEQTSGELVHVRTLTVGTDMPVFEKTYVGKVIAARSHTIIAPCPGTLEQVFISDGQEVNAGQQIAKIRSEAVQSTYDIASASLSQAEDAYRRLSSVSENGSVAQIKIVEVESALAKAKAAMKAAQDALDRCTIKAPFHGTISGLYCDQGVELSMAEPIARLIDASDLEISVTVPESEIASLKVGDVASISVPSLDGLSSTARFIRKGVDADMVSHSYTCVLKPLENIDRLQPGMVCKVIRPIASGVAKKASIVIPASVVRTDASGRYVWTVDSLSTVHKTRVVLGGFSGKGVSLTEGLTAGDKVITEGAAKVSTGMRVEVAE